MKTPARRRAFGVAILLGAFSLSLSCPAQVTLQQLTNGLVDYYPLDSVTTNGLTITTPDLFGGRDMTLVNMNSTNVVLSTRPNQIPGSASNCLYLDQQGGLGTTIMYYDSQGQNPLDGSGDFLPFCNQVNATMNFWIKCAANTNVNAYNDKRFFGECDDGSSAGTSPLWLFGASNGGGLPVDRQAHFLFRQNTGAVTGQPLNLADGTKQLPDFSYYWTQGTNYTAGSLLDGNWHMFTVEIESNRVIDIYVDAVRDPGPGIYIDANGNPGYGPDIPLTNYWYTTNIYASAGVSNPPPNGYVRWVWNGLFAKGVTAFGGFRRQGANSGGIPMLLDDLAFWKRQLSSDEIAVLMTNGFVCPFCRPCAFPLISSFSADFGEVGQGDTVTLRWNTTGSTNLFISGVGDVTALGLVGSTNVLVQNNTNFTLTATSLFCVQTSIVSILVLPGVDPNWHLIQRFDGVFSNADPSGGVSGNGWISLLGSFLGPLDLWNVIPLTNSGAQNRVLAPRTGYNRNASSPTGFESMGALSYANLGSLTLAPGQSNTLFFRFALQDPPVGTAGGTLYSDLDFGVGLTDMSPFYPPPGMGYYIATGGGLGPYFSILRSSGGVYHGGPFDLFAPDTADPADGNSAGSFSYLASVDPNGLRTNVNYFVWMDIVDRDTHAVTNPGVSTNTVNEALYSVWLQKQGETSRTLLFSGFHGNRDYVNYAPVSDFPTPYLKQLFLNIGSESLVAGQTGAYFATNMIAVDDFYLSKTGFNGSIPKLLELSSIVRTESDVAITWYSLGSLFQTNTYTVQRKVRIAPKVLLPVEGEKDGLRDTLCQKSGYRGRNG